MDQQTFLLTALGLAERLNGDPDALQRAMQALLDLSNGDAASSPGPHKVSPSPFEKGLRYKGSYTGTSKDRLGRTQCFVQGVHVPCAGRSPLEGRGDPHGHREGGSSHGSSSSRVEVHGGGSASGKYTSLGGRGVRVNVGRPDHLKEQLYARKVYALFSKDPPDVKIQEVDENQALVTPVPPDAKPLGQSPDARKAFQMGFILDAFLSNMDVVGKDASNVLVAPDGTVYRMDVASCLRFNSDGSDKDWFSDKVVEVELLLDPQKSPETAKAFLGLKPFDGTVKAQVRALLTRGDEVLQVFPDDLRPTMEKRLSYLEGRSR